MIGLNVMPTSKAEKKWAAGSLIRSAKVEISPAMSNTKQSNAMYEGSMSRIIGAESNPGYVTRHTGQR